MQSGSLNIKQSTNQAIKHLTGNKVGYKHKTSNKLGY